MSWGMITHSQSGRGAAFRLFWCVAPIPGIHTPFAPRSEPSGMKIVASVFLFIFGYAHIRGDLWEAIGRPLSLFREQGNAWDGYALFALLLLAIALLLWQLVCLRWLLDAAFLVATGVVLSIVATTPSFDLLHNLLALLVLFSTYAYFATVFYRLNSRWLFVHLLVPVLLVIATRAHSYGLWQKCTILYYLFVVVLQHHLCVGWLRTARRSRGSDLPVRRETERRQKVYRVEE